MMKIAVIIFEDFEEIEAITPIDILRRAGLEVLVLTISSKLLTLGRSNIGVNADFLFSEKSSELFDAIIICGGAGVHKVSDLKELKEFVNRHNDAKKIVSAICAAPIVLKNAGVLEGKPFTSHGSVAEKIGAGYLNKPVVVSDNIVTSQGAGTAIDFALCITSLLLNTTTSQNIAKSIYYNSTQC